MVSRTPKPRRSRRGGGTKAKVYPYDNTSSEIRRVSLGGGRDEEDVGAGFACGGGLVGEISGKFKGNFDGHEGSDGGQENAEP